jgi:drug/metabolite transporter (DMT)-like permease
VKKTTWAILALVAVAAAWGGAFVTMKDAIAREPFYDFLATRFLIATVLMILAKPRVFKAIDRDLLRKGVILGFLLGMGYITQTIGLAVTTAAITGFITGLYVICTPILAWLLFGHQPSKRIVIGVILATVALGFISINNFAIEVGQIWVIACAVLFAAHIVGLGVWSPGKDTYALTVVQLGTVGIVCTVGALIDHPGYQPPPDGGVWFAVLFCAVFATAVAFWVQTWAQSMFDSSRVAIILTLEVLFTALLAVGVGQETLALKTIIGGAIMVVAMLIVEWPSRDNDVTKIEIFEPLEH